MPIRKLPKAIALLLAIVSCFAAHAQTEIKKISTLYNSRKYNEAIAAGKENIIKGYDLPSSNLIVGRCYVDINKSESAIPYLRTAIQMDADQTWISGWGHAYLGVALVKTGSKDSGITELKQAVAIRKTDNSVDFARNLLDKIIDPDALIKELNLVKVESDSIIYYFQDSGKMLQPVYRYIRQHDSVYVELCRIFHPMPPQKLRFFVFTHKAKAEKALGRKLGFTDAQESVCYSLSDQTLGHEMCHFVAFWSNGTSPANESKFINEGIAVCFDMRREDAFERAKAALLQQNFKGSVLDIWSREYDYGSDLVYPVAGAFLRHLYQRMKNEEFLAFVHDQSFAHLRKLLGPDFDDVIKEFDLKVGLAK